MVLPYLSTIQLPVNIEIQVAEYWNTGNVTASLGRRESLSLIFIPDLPGASLKENKEESSLLKVHESQQCVVYDIHVLSALIFHILSA